MADLELKRYTSKMEEEWDDFVWQSRNGTIFHTQRFIGYHPPGRFEDCSLMFGYKSRLVAVLPAAIQARDGKRILRSHPGTSYGGPVLAFEVGTEQTIEILQMLVDFAQQNSLDAVEMRIAPRVYQRYPSEELDLALAYLGFEITSVELSSAIQLSGGEESWWQLFRSDTARSIRKALEEDSLCVRDSDDWARYWEILEENLRYHDVRPTHTLDEIQRLKRLFPQRIRLFASYLDDTITAGIVCFLCNDKAVHTFYHAQDYDYQRYRSLNLVIYRLMQWGYEQGYRYMNLGISTEDSGRVINPGLFRFKEGFGARGVVRKYYGLEIN